MPDAARRSLRDHFEDCREKSAHRILAMVKHLTGTFPAAPRASSGAIVRLVKLVRSQICRESAPVDGIKTWIKR